MAHDHDTLIEEDVAQDAWSGGKPPMKASYGKLMMWYFLLSDAFTFAGFLIAYGTLRFSSATWPIPDSVFSTTPFGLHESFPGGHAPLIFVTFMSFLLIISSVTMVRGVQEGHRENKRGVAFWMFLTVLGGLGFLSCQAWEWNNLINVEHMTVTKNPFGTHTEAGTYLNADGTTSSDIFEVGDGYLMHMVGGHHTDPSYTGAYDKNDDLADGKMNEYVDFSGYRIDKDGYILRKFNVIGGENDGQTISEQMGPKAFGALFFFITGFHGFHVFSGVVFLLIIMVNVISGLYEKRKNGYEMVEKIGLYWHFVDLVWVFVFLVFYLL
jgi:cytochrome c oxidase subunit 3